MSRDWPDRPVHDLTPVGDDFVEAEEAPSSDYPTGSLVTLRLIWNAIRRQLWLLLAIALAGFAAGALLPVVHPPPSTATTRLLLVHEEGSNPAEAMATDASLASTHTVAQRVIDQLGLSGTAHDLLERYTTTQLTDRVLEISATAPTDAQATRLAATVADTFLDFRMEQIRADQRPIKHQLAEARSRATSLRAKAEQTDLVIAVDDDAQNPKLERAEERVNSLEQTLQDMRLSAARMSGSRTLDPAAPVPQSLVYLIGRDALTGLMGGLALGLGLVVLVTVLSDRLRTREDIAHALGARITLSLGRQGRSRWQPVSGWLRRSGLGGQDAQLAARHLHARIPWLESSTPTLAIVSIDSHAAAVSITASLGACFAESGYRVLIVDQTGGLLATRLGLTAPGIGEATVGDGTSTVAIYLPDTSAGPSHGPLVEPLAGDPVLAEWMDADVVLTVADLSPAFGADHLRGWATHAAAVTTAGRSTATMMRSAGEMVRGAGIRLGSAVLVGADRTDETIGLPREPVTPVDDDPVDMVSQDSGRYA